MDATLQLVNLLPDNNTGNKAYGSYLDQLIESEHECLSVTSRCKLTNDVLTHVEVQPTSDQMMIPTIEVTQLIPDVPGNCKHPIDHLHGPNTIDGMNLSINEFLFAWTNVPVTNNALNPNLAQTLVLKANYIIDVKCIKNDLIIRLDCLDFPHTLWLNVLLDQFVDLDRVYAGYYALDADTWHTQSIGEVDITPNHVKVVQVKSYFQSLHLSHFDLIFPFS